MTLALPCLALPCLALPCLALPCLALPCLALPCFSCLLSLLCCLLDCLTPVAIEVNLARRLLALRMRKRRWASNGSRDASVLHSCEFGIIWWYKRQLTQPSYRNLHRNSSLQGACGTWIACASAAGCVGFMRSGLRNLTGKRERNMPSAAVAESPSMGVLCCIGKPMFVFVYIGIRCFHFLNRYTVFIYFSCIGRYNYTCTGICSLYVL